MAYCKKLFRMYHVENQTCHVRTFYTNTISGGACRGYGSPQAHAVTEVNLDQAANAIGMDPCELRLKNIVHPMDDDPTGGTNPVSYTHLDVYKRQAGGRGIHA